MNERVSVLHQPAVQIRAMLCCLMQRLDLPLPRDSHSTAIRVQHDF